jgi:uncharacterized protein (DUF1684 family)
MKLQPSVLFPFLAVLILLGIFASLMQFSPESNNPFDAGTILEFRRIKNRMLSTSVGAPFYRVSGFDSLRYFQPDQAHVYLADFQPVRDGDLLDLMPDMPGIPSHSVAGFAVVKKDDLKDTLFILKSTREQSDSVFFVPFSDESNGKETYGGGRYLDLIIRRGRPLLLDFNYASNPYCAYRADFICPRVPAFNHINWKIEAGEKNYPGNTGH